MDKPWTGRDNDPNARPRVATVNDLPSRTVESDVERAEISQILRKYEGVGIVDHLANVDRIFRDVSEFEDFADLMRQAKEAERHFLELPPQLRDVFDNDHHRWLDVAHDPEKLDEVRPKLEELGLLEPVATPAEAGPPPTPAAPAEVSDAS